MARFAGLRGGLNISTGAATAGMLGQDTAGTSNATAEGVVHAPRQGSAKPIEQRIQIRSVSHRQHPPGQRPHHFRNTRT